MWCLLNGFSDKQWQKVIHRQREWAASGFVHQIHRGLQESSRHTDDFGLSHKVNITEIYGKNDIFNGKNGHEDVDNGFRSYSMVSPHFRTIYEKSKNKLIHDIFAF